MINHKGNDLQRQIRNIGSWVSLGLSTIGCNAPNENKLLLQSKLPATSKIDITNQDLQQDIEDFDVTLLEAPTGSGLVFDDTARFTSLTYSGLDLGIYKPKSLASTDGAAKVNENVELSAHQFFILPTPMFDKEVLKQAFDGKKLISEINGVKYYRMDTEVSLLLDLIKEKAASHLNSLYPGNDFSSERNIRMAPFLRIEFYATIDGKKTNIGSYPNFEDNKFARLENYRDPLPLSITGTEEYLQLILNDASIEAVIYVEGFLLKQNIYYLALNAIANNNYFDYLTGEASWEKFEEYSATTGGGGIDLGIVKSALQKSVGEQRATSHSFVTRTQVRNFVSKITANFTGSAWEEFNSSPERVRMLEERLVNYILSRSEEIYDIAIDRNYNLVIEDENLKQDLSPDVVSKFNSHIKSNKNFTNVDYNKVNASTTDEDTTKKSKDTTHTDKLTGSAGATSRDTIKIISDDDFDTGMETRTTIPKSIKLYRFNSSSFNNSISTTQVDTKVTSATKPYILAGSFITQKNTKEVMDSELIKLNFSIPTAPHVGGKPGGDADLALGLARVILQAHNLRRENEIMKLDFILRGIEDGGDRTTLLGSTTIDITDPQGRTIKEITGPKEFYIEMDTRARNIVYPAVLSDPPKDRYGVPLVHILNMTLEENSIVSEFNMDIDTEGQDHNGGFKVSGKIEVRYDAIQVASEEVFEIDPR